MAVVQWKKLPYEGRSWPELQEELLSMRSGDADWRSGRTHLHVYHAGDDVLDVARQAYSMFMSENALAPAAFPSLKRMQDDLVAIALSLLGGSKAACGAVTSGGTESIILAVRSAYRAYKKQRPDVERPHLLLPVSAHPAYDKAAELMRLEVVRVPDLWEYRACVKGISRQITEETMMLVASAPSLPFGTIDPVEELGRLAMDRGVWLHVDACIGGFLAPYAAKFQPGIPRFDLSVPGVRSLSADLHKFGYAAKGASIILYSDERDGGLRHFEFSGWPKGVYRTETLAGTRPGGAIAAAWAVMHYLGEAGYTSLAQRVMMIRDRYIEGIRSIGSLRLLGDPDLCVISFTSEHLDIHAVGDLLELRGWYVSRLSSPAALHMTVTPTHDLAVDAYLQDLRVAVDEVARSGSTRRRREVMTY